MCLGLNCSRVLVSNVCAQSQIVAFGDLAQMSPTAATTLVCNLLDANSIHYPRRTYSYTFEDASCPRSRAARLFADFEIAFLTVQQRVDDCPRQSQLIVDLQNGTFRVTKQVRELFEQHQLTREDVIADRGWLTSCAWVLTNNAERVALNHQRLLAWAKENRKPVICWDLDVHGADWMRLTGAQVKHLRETDPRLREWFVEGAPATIIENIKPSMGLANGTDCYYHSLSYSHAMSGPRKLEFEATLAAALPGQIIHLPYKPDKVFVQVYMQTNHLQYPEKWALTRTPDSVVVPVGLCYAATRAGDKENIEIIAQPERGIPLCALGHWGFRLAPNLATTFHKIQGTHSAISPLFLAL